MTVRGRLEKLREHLRSYRFAFNNELELQQGINLVLLASDFLTIQREVRHGERDRYDFVVDGDLIIEVKVNGSRSDMLRQLSRYAEDENVAGILLITTRAAHRDLPDSFNSKPLCLHFLMDNSF
jgi:hypothetical protein